MDWIEKKQLAMEAVQSELFEATTLHPAFHSAHEGYAVLAEEVEELWDEVTRRKRNAYAMRKEAVQVAAMAVRFIIDICDREEGKTLAEVFAEEDRRSNGQDRG